MRRSRSVGVLDPLRECVRPDLRVRRLRRGRSRLLVGGQLPLGDRSAPSRSGRHRAAPPAGSSRAPRSGAPPSEGRRGTWPRSPGVPGRSPARPPAGSEQSRAWTGRGRRSPPGAHAGSGPPASLRGRTPRSGPGAQRLPGQARTEEALNVCLRCASHRPGGKSGGTDAGERGVGGGHVPVCARSHRVDRSRAQVRQLPGCGVVLAPDAADQAPCSLPRQPCPPRSSRPSCASRLPAREWRRCWRAPAGWRASGSSSGSPAPRSALASRSASPPSSCPGSAPRPGRRCGACSGSRCSCRSCRPDAPSGTAASCRQAAHRPSSRA